MAFLQSEGVFLFPSCRNGVAFLCLNMSSFLLPLPLNSLQNAHRKPTEILILTPSSVWVLFRFVFTALRDFINLKKNSEAREEKTKHKSTNQNFISMSSDLFVHGDSSSSLFPCSASDLVFPSDADFQFLADSFSDRAIDLHAYCPHQNPLAADDSNSNSNSNSNSDSVDQFIPMPALSLSHCNDFPLIPDSSSSNGFQNLSNFEVKNEESHLGFTANSFSHHPLLFDPSDNNPTVHKSLLQRSLSEKPGFGLPSRLESLLMESSNFPNNSLPCPESDFFSSQIRRVLSTGDLQNSSMGRSGSSGCGQGSFSSPLPENGNLEEGNFKVGRYSAEERKEKISKYRAKRRQRNFNKTIKYACRKTLADNRPRIRGRFARNDEPGEIPKAACSSIEEDEDDFWMEGVQAGEEEGTQYNEVYGQMQFQYCEF